MGLSELCPISVASSVPPPFHVIIFLTAVNIFLRVFFSRPELQSSWIHTLSGHRGGQRHLRRGGVSEVRTCCYVTDGWRCSAADWWLACPLGLVPCAPWSPSLAWAGPPAGTWRGTGRTAPSPPPSPPWSTMVRRHWAFTTESHHFLDPDVCFFCTLLVAW